MYIETTKNRQCKKNARDEINRLMKDIHKVGTMIPRTIHPIDFNIILSNKNLPTPPRENPTPLQTSLNLLPQRPATHIILFILLHHPFGSQTTHPLRILVDTDRSRRFGESQAWAGFDVIVIVVGISGDEIAFVVGFVVLGFGFGFG